ncbi:hypothetical protein KGMB01110_20110 [Mediterraneibacter butyricigenes]|uniref:Collagen-like protein n=1 Tax=Mediterraneibacter butyricigenes TaxID=2316025 RepID=A0A391P273_9FIRM|nr:hypothetical protein [Mediterraneibacter butyricigenes]GCA67575.1 hypothetical protein KGMB01110_20110 [Mediterraneibacter butyricigenes]
MRNRKIFATFLIAATCLAIFAGCGKKDETEKGKQQEEKTTEATAGEKEDKISNTLEVRNNGDAIQWRADSQDSWNDLVKLTELKGADGQDGTNGKNGVNGTNSKNVEIRKEASYIQWRYAGGSWKNLVALSSLAGSSGQNGENVELQMTDSEIQWRYPDGEWKKLVALADITGPAGQDGSDGTDGKTAEFQVDGDTLQWRYRGESVWLNLYDLTTLKGADGSDGQDGTDGKDGADGQNGVDGKTVEVRKTDSAVQWRYEGEEWQDLVALSDITGPAGQDGSDGIDGKTAEFRVDGDHLQWRYRGESVWLNLYDLTTLKGADGSDGQDGTDGKDGVNGTNGKDGTNGIDGKTPEIRVDGNTLQWRYTGESNWQDLYDLSALKGADGVNGADGQNGTCSGYFYAQGNSTQLNSTLPFNAQINSGNLVTYNGSQGTITLKQGHVYQVSFSGSIALGATQSNQSFGAAITDGYDNTQSMNSTLIRGNFGQSGGNSDMSIQVPMTYNRLYDATNGDIVLQYTLINYMLVYTKVDSFQYNLMITALN